MKVEELVINKYYISIKNGLCIYRKTREHEGKLYYCFEFNDDETLMWSKPYVEKDIRNYENREGKKLKLNKLRDHKRWNRTKEGALKKAREQASQLVKLYAERKNVKGFRFSQDGEEQRKFENGFPFDLTDGQISALKDIKADLESDKLMDRLLYGDVGSGKTCVAMCTIFKVVQDKKQSVLLAPTTILAQQHYTNFIKRFKDYKNIKIACLCSNTKPKEKKQIIQDFNNGIIDVLIGTHSVISDKFNYKNTELLVTDEEQEFSIKMKNQIKSYKTDVNILTMSATFIPRTLYMNMAGITDISMIKTSPRGKKPIDTKAIKWDDGIIKQYINRELERNGQIYFLQNDISTMGDVKNKLQELVPTLRITIVNGKMPKKEINQVINDFKEYKYDLLIATSIIKTGIDISRANTMILNKSDMLGLSSLYQLRGRCGRNSLNAYCLLVTDNKELSDTAIKRLKVLEGNTALDSAMRVSEEDLKIRGQGELFGSRQHGEFPKVGIELYEEILKNEIKKEKEKEDNKENNNNAAINNSELCLAM